MGRQHFGYPPPSEQSKKELALFYFANAGVGRQHFGYPPPSEQGKKLAFLFDFLKNTLYTEFENGFQIIELWQEFIIQNNVN